MQTIKLNSGFEMPILGLGTWRSEPKKAAAAVEYALTKAMYTHIDCAAIYKNEAEIGAAFEKSFQKGIRREDIFITSKLWNTMHEANDVEQACKQTLTDLKLDYLDLYLMHWGVAFPKEESGTTNKNGIASLAKVSVQQSWEAMQSLVHKGLVKSIGVSNFTTLAILDMLTYAQILPAVNQIEVHPHNSQTDLVEFLQKIDIAVTAYSPLGSPGNKTSNILDEKIIKELASKYGKTPAQVAIRWAIQRGTIVIPKSVTLDRIKENSEVFDFELSLDEKAQIDSLNQNKRYINPLEWWGIPYFN